MKSDDYWLNESLKLAHKAAKAGEVPVGAIIVQNDEIIGQGWNQREGLCSPTAHAEIMAIEDAAKYLNAWRLEKCSLYVTLEPCPMCAGAIINSRIPKVVYGASDPKAGAVRSLYELLTDSRLNHQVEVQYGVMERECSEILKSFFRDLRKNQPLAK